MIKKSFELEPKDTKVDWKKKKNVPTDVWIFIVWNLLTILESRAELWRRFQVYIIFLNLLLLITYKFKTQSAFQSKSVRNFLYPNIVMTIRNCPVQENHTKQYHENQTMVIVCKQLCHKKVET